jgi:hypothetical protein
MSRQTIRASVTVAISGLLCFPSAAQDFISEHPVSSYYVPLGTLLLLAVALAIYSAHGAFESPRATLGEGPAPPKYMAQARQYRMGEAAFVSICLLIYGLIIWYYRDLLPIIDFEAPSYLREVIERLANDSKMSLPVVVILAGAVLVSLLKTEREWNPLFMLRRLVWSWVSIPQLASLIMEAARNDLEVSAEKRLKVAKRAPAAEETSTVDVRDFEKDKHSVDRNWAELCYVQQWLTDKHNEQKHNTFFNEPSFSWRELEASYTEMSEQIVPLKRALGPGSGLRASIFADAAAKIENLRRQYCRLAACFIVFRNETRKATVDEANEFGAKIPHVVTRANPLRYVIIYFATILLSIYLGVWLSSTLWDLMHGDFNFVSTQDPNLVTRWTYFSLASFGTPIAVILLLRYLGWTYDRDQPASYLTSYATIFLIGLCVSAVSLALAIKFSPFSPNPLAESPLSELVFTRFRWGVSPALVCVCVVYHVDRQIDPLMPDVGALGAEGRFGHRLAACALFGLLVVCFSILPTMSIIASPDPAWSVAKLRAVVIGTIFIVGLIMALVSEFCLIKPKQPKPETNNSIPPPVVAQER